MLRCQILGHRYRFWGDGRTMRWQCERGCGALGAKRYGSPEEAARYAAAFDRDPARNLGRRAPLGLLPLRLLYAARRRRRG